MNGATAEPWASTISTPNRPVMTNIGNSQYFFRARRNAQSSLIIDMMAALKLVGERIGRRAGRLARHPVALGARIEPCAQRVPAGEPHDQAERRKYAIEQDSHRDRAHDIPQEDAEPQPPSAGSREERGPDEGDRGQNRGDRERPPAWRSPVEKRPARDGREHDGENQSKRPVGRPFNL